MSGNIKPAKAKDYTRHEGACSAVLVTEENMEGVAAWVREREGWTARVETLEYEDGEYREVVAVGLGRRTQFRVGEGHYLSFERGLFWRWPRVLFRGLHDEVSDAEDAPEQTGNFVL